MSVDDYFFPEGSIAKSIFDKINFRRYMNQEKSLLPRTRGKFENRDLYTFGWGRRTCPDIHLTNVQLFSIFTTVFSKCTIGPIIGDDLIYPDHETERNAGIKTEILPYKVRFVPLVF